MNTKTVNNLLDYGDIESSIDEINRFKNYSLKDFLRIAPERRSERHCKYIAKFVKSVNLFSQFQKTRQVLYQLCKEIFLKEYNPKTTVYSQGDVGDAFYIIYTGSARAYAKMPTSIRNFSNLKEIMKLKPGDTFGDLALMHDSIRAETVITDEKCELIVLTKESFQKHAHIADNSPLLAIMENYKYFPIFKDLPEKEMIKIASKSLQEKYPSGAVLLRKGQPVGDIYYIKNGRVSVVRKIHFRVDSSKKMMIGDISDPRPEELKYGLYESIMIQIDELTGGDSFGDYALLKNEEVIGESYITNAPTEVIRLPAGDLNETFSSQTITKYKALLKAYPSDTSIRKSYFEEMQWDSWKKHLLADIKVNKLNEKLGYAMQMRKPLLKLKPIKSMIGDLDKLFLTSAHKKLLDGGQQEKIEKKLMTLRRKSKSYVNLNEHYHHHGHGPSIKPLLESSLSAGKGDIAKKRGIVDGVGGDGSGISPDGASGGAGEQEEVSVMTGDKRERLLKQSVSNSVNYSTSKLDNSITIKKMVYKTPQHKLNANRRASMVNLSDEIYVASDKDKMNPELVMMNNSLNNENSQILSKDNTISNNPNASNENNSPLKNQKILNSEANSEYESHQDAPSTKLMDQA